nr:hybrid signal transduction histidine kinase M [Tanacetum cinerariifolium]
MEAYFQKIESIITILTSLDSYVNDEDVVHYALKGLPDKYNQVCGYMHYKDTFLDLKTVRLLLITKEIRLKSKALALHVKSSFPMVLMAESGNNRHSSSTPPVKSWRPCFNFAKVLVGLVIRDDTTNDLLHKLLQQLGTLTTNNTCSTNPTSGPPAVALTIGLAILAGLNGSPTPPPTFPAQPAHTYFYYYHRPSIIPAAYPPTTAQPVQSTTHPTGITKPGNIGPNALSGQATSIPHAFNTETL